MMYAVDRWIFAVATVPASERANEEAIGIHGLLGQHPGRGSRHTRDFTRVAPAPPYTLVIQLTRLAAAHPMQ